MEKIYKILEVDSETFMESAIINDGYTKEEFQYCNEILSTKGGKNACSVFNSCDEDDIEWESLRLFNN